MIISTVSSLVLYDMPKCFNVAAAAADEVDGDDNEVQYHTPAKVSANVTRMRMMMSAMCIYYLLGIIFADVHACCRSLNNGTAVG
jgi:hypothetical protein